MQQSIQQLRLARGWSIRELAARSEIDHRQLSRYEEGTRGLPGEHRLVLAREFQCHPSDIMAEPAKAPGRPKRAHGELVSRFVVPGSYDPTCGDRPLAHYLPAARKANPELMCTLERDTDPDWRFFLARAPGNSGFEASLVMRAMNEGAGATDAAPLEVGFTRFPVVNHEDERTIVGHCRVPALATRDWLMLLQVTVATPRIYRMDGLIIVTNPVRTFINFEADGRGHNNIWEEQRTRAIGLPTLRVSEDDVREGLRLTERLQRMGYCRPEGC